MQAYRIRGKKLGIYNSFSEGPGVHRCLCLAILIPRKQLDSYHPVSG